MRAVKDECDPAVYLRCVLMARAADIDGAAAPGAERMGGCEHGHAAASAAEAADVR